MKEIISFLKDIFLMNDTNTKIKVGLSQFKAEKPIEEPIKKITPLQKNMKLSDLMRKSA